MSAASAHSHVAMNPLDATRNGRVEILAIYLLLGYVETNLCVEVELERWKVVRLLSSRT